MSGLEEFYVSMNEVAEMEELDHFQQLRILELGSTRPQYCVASEGHYLSQNGVSELEGISTLVNLPILNVSLNKLMNANDIQNLTWFHEFRISHHMQHGYGFQGDNLVTSLD